MFLIGEVCGACRKVSSNNEPTEVSRCHSRQRLKALGLREAQGETDLCNPRVGELLSACRDAQLSKGNR